jgi:hypothetical protein
MYCGVLYSVLMLVKGTAKVEENSGLAEVDLSAKTENVVNDSNQETQTLEKLRAEEAALIEETQNWTTLRDSLRNKIKEEIELKTVSVSRLKIEKENLRVLCEQLTNALNSGVIAAQSKQTGLK